MRPPGRHMRRGARSGRQSHIGRWSAAFALLTAFSALGACSDDPTGPTFEVITEVTYDTSLGIDLADYTELASGVWIRDISVGTTDTFDVGESATVNYTGWLRSGSQFDSGQFSFPTANGARPIAGFELGLDGVMIGGVRRMIIPPQLAYGATGAGPIPGGAIVIFEVELVSID